MIKPKRSSLEILFKENTDMIYKDFQKIAREKVAWKNPEAKHLSYIYMESVKKVDLKILDDLLDDLRRKKSKSFRNHVASLVIESPDLLDHVFKKISPFTYSKKNEILIEYLFDNFGNVFNVLEIIEKDSNSLYDSMTFKICFRRESKLRNYLMGTSFMRNFIDRLIMDGKTKNSRHIENMFKNLRKKKSLVMLYDTEIYFDLYNDSQQYKKFLTNNADSIKNYCIGAETTGFGFDIYDTVISSLPKKEIERIKIDLPNAKKKFFPVYVFSKDLLRGTKLDTFKSILEKLFKEGSGISDYCEILVAYEILFTLREHFN